MAAGEMFQFVVITMWEFLYSFTSIHFQWHKGLQLINHFPSINFFPCSPLNDILEFVPAVTELSTSLKTPEVSNPLQSLIAFLEMNKTKTSVTFHNCWQTYIFNNVSTLYWGSVESYLSRLNPQIQLVTEMKFAFYIMITALNFKVAFIEVDKPWQCSPETPWIFVLLLK